MCSHSKRQDYSRDHSPVYTTFRTGKSLTSSLSKAVRFRLLFIAVIAAVAAWSSAWAQNHDNMANLTQTVQVTPPYTNKLSDYFEPGKIMSIITVSGAEMDVVKLAVRGYIESTDQGGIKIGTRRGSAYPLSIQGTVQIAGPHTTFSPYTLTYNDIRQIFSMQTLEYSGITREEVMRNGLPEGSYRICFELRDNYGDRKSVV